MKLKDKLKGLGDRLKNSQLSPLLRITDKILTNGTLFNILDKNNSPEGKIDIEKYLRDGSIWVPLVAFSVACFMDYVSICVN